MRFVTSVSIVLLSAGLVSCGTDGGSDTERRVSVPGDYPTITAAVESAAPGTTIEVEPGTPFREWYNLAPLTGKPVLLALHGGRTAREWAERSDDDVLAAGITALQQFIDAGW